MTDNKKAMLFTLNERSQYLLSHAVKRTKSKTVDRALEYYHKNGPAGYYVSTDELPDDFDLDSVTIFKLNVNKNQYDRVVISLTKARQRIREQDDQIKELLEAKKKSRFFGLIRSK